MSEILNKIDMYLIEMAAPNAVNVNRAVQLLDWMSNPKYATRIGNKKNGTNLKADKILNNVMASVKKNLPQYKELKKIKDVGEMKSALTALIDINPSIKTLRFTELMDAQQEILNIWNSLQSHVSRDKKKERNATGDRFGIKTSTNTGSAIPKEQKRTNKDIDKELETIKSILDAERKTPRYKKMLKIFMATDAKSIDKDQKGIDQGRTLNSDLLNSSKLSNYLPDLDNSKIPGVSDAVKAIKQILVIAYAEHRAYQDSDNPVTKKAILNNAKYLQSSLKGITQIANNVKKGFGLPTNTKPKKKKLSK